MNGAWYSWGQQPAEDVATFRRAAQAVRVAPASQILWSPNQSGGYPFQAAGSRRSPAPRRSRCWTLTPTAHGRRPTIRTGRTTRARSTSTGSGCRCTTSATRTPWGENAKPEPGKFAAKLTGSYDGRGGDKSALPDFHAQSARRTGQPLAISETSALYNSGRVGQGAGNTTIKTAWLKQVFADDVPEQFEQLRLIMWFEQDKVEPDVPGGVTNWSLSRVAELREAFREALPDWLRQAP